MDEDAPEPEPAPYTGPRTLDGRPAPASIPAAGSSSSSAPPKKKGGFATLDSLNQAGPSGGHAGHGHAHDDDDSSDEDFQPGEEPRDLFAGGEKSGLAVQDPARNDPRKVVNDILKKARAYVHLY
jgi:UBX domain-containing protein 1